MRPRGVEGQPSEPALLDEALQRLGHAQPPSGLESRIHARLATAQAARQGARPWAFLRIPTWQAACAGIVLLAMLAFGVRMHQRMRARQATDQAVAPLVAAHSSRGLATAAGRQSSLTHVHPTGRSRNRPHGGVGRASIARNAHLPAGIAAPATPHAIQ